MEKRIIDTLNDLQNDNLQNRSIFKYHRINKFLYDLLINSEIWFSDPFSYNDPFDCNLTIDGNNRPEQIKKYFNVANWEKSADTDNDIQKLITSNFQNVEAFQRKLNSISRKAIGQLGLTCFTQTKDNLLMWAHYTEDHKGVCLEFDYKKDTGFFSPFKKVSYDKKYPIYNYYDDKKMVVEMLMLHKSNHWEYEQEVRIIKKKKGLYPFNPESLIGIYFGVRTPDSQIETIKKLVKERVKYNHTKFYKGKLDQTDYKLIFDEV